MHPSDIDNLVKRAIAHQKSNRKDAAEKLFQQALAAQPDHCAALHYFGLLCQQRGNDAAALDFLRRSVIHPPGSEQPHYHNNLATAFGRTGRFDESLRSIEQALALKPDYAQAWGNKGVVLEKQNKLEESRAALAKAIELKPDFIDATVNLGNVLTRMGKDKEALEHLEAAALRFPKDATLAINLGNALRRCGRVEAAIASLRRAVERRPDSPEARNNLGVALHDAGMLAEAEAELRKSIELKQSYADAHWNLSLVLLHKGDFHNGWMEYEWRRHLKEDAISKRNFPQPPWAGGPLEGRKILVLCEQGLGDTLQFIRYAQVLAERGAKVIVECQPRLENLLRGVAGIERVVARGEPLPPFDCHVRLMSIPGIVGTTPDTIPAGAAYLKIDPGFVAAWKERLHQMCPNNGGADIPVCHGPMSGVIPDSRIGPSLRIGLAWQGNTAYRGDPQRSIPLSTFAPLAEIAGTTFFNLQKGYGSEQAAALTEKLPLLQFDPPLDDMAGAFFDTAAVMLNLDLIITSDTSIAHLAGALGVPTWIALPMACDWRWQGTRSDSPWYPNVQLFRQSKRGDWEDVFLRIREQLANLTAGHQAAAPKNGKQIILAPISAGELLDKITILQIKAQRITDVDKLAHVRHELAELEAVKSRHFPTRQELEPLASELLQVNQALWDVEDGVRQCQANEDRGAHFVELARSVCRHNDRRSALKQQVNQLTHSAIVEEKSYAGPSSQTD